MKKKKLDLHGIRHEDVQSILDSHIFENDPPFEIITGNSAEMRNVVIKTLKEYGLRYFSPHFGCIVVISS